MGGTGQDSGNAGTLCPTSPWPQFQGICAGLFQKGQGRRSLAGRIRKENCADAGCSESMKDSSKSGGERDHAALDSARSGARLFGEPFRALIFWRTFLLCQCWLMVWVILASQDRSLRSSKTSAVAKNLMAFGGGVPSGLSRREEIRIGISWVWQPSIHAACSTESRAGGCPTSVRN